MSRGNSGNISRRSLVSATVAAAAATGGIGDVLASHHAPVVLKL